VGGTEIAFHVDGERLPFASTNKLIAGLSSKTILTNTTTAEDVDWLATTGCSTLITTTPRFEGRSFGTNLTEACITAVLGSDRPLSIEEMNKAVDALQIRPDVTRFD